MRTLHLCLLKLKRPFENKGWNVGLMPSQVKRAIKENSFGDSDFNY